MAITYRQAGVDIDAGNELVSRIGPLARATNIREVISGVGGFAGMCGLPSGMQDPVLVSGTDGVGTKLKVAFATGVHDTIGIDLVAMSVNDIIVCGARPLFFLDYFGTGRLSVDVGEAVVRGIAEGCKQSGCALLGGETAELPGMYADGEYDLAGFAVGVVERAKILDGTRAGPGDVVLAIASSGLHSNGYSLARKVLEHMKLGFEDAFPGDPAGRTVGQLLLTPTKLYAKTTLRLAEKLGNGLRAMSHITGGGLPENFPRTLPKGLGAVLDLGSYERPLVFRTLQAGGPVEESEMRRTFNLGVGMTFVVAPASVDLALSELADAGETAWKLGEVVEANEGERVRFV